MLPLSGWAFTRCFGPWLERLFPTCLALFSVHVQYCTRCFSAQRFSPPPNTRLLHFFLCVLSMVDVYRRRLLPCLRSPMLLLFVFVCFFFFRCWFSIIMLAVGCVLRDVDEGEQLGGRVSPARRVESGDQPQGQGAPHAHHHSCLPCDEL